MKWLNNRFLLLSYVTLLAALVLVGCSLKEDPSEFLTVCGNHSCGELVMVTSDTSSEGYQYLNPSLSPDGSRILFTADWMALKSDPRSADEFTTRQILMIATPSPEDIVQPEQNLAAQGAQLVRVADVTLPFGGESVTISETIDADKGEPVWIDDGNIAFWISTMRGNRLFRANITDPSDVTAECLYVEPDDFSEQVRPWQHMQPAVSADGQWLVYTRSGCAIADSFETCTGASLWALQLSTVSLDEDDPTVVFQLTEEVSRLENPSFSADGQQIVFSAGLDMGNVGTGSGTEIFTIDFDPVGLAAGDVGLNNNLHRNTRTTYSDGDPISGVLNRNPRFSLNSDWIYFVSNRRAPAITLHDRNIWRTPTSGGQDPEIVFFSREDDLDFSLSSDGRTLVLASMMGFPTNVLTRLEEESYQRLATENPSWTEVALRQAALGEANQLKFFEGVMAQLYLFSDW